MMLFACFFVFAWPRRYRLFGRSSNASVDATARRGVKVSAARLIANAFRLQ
jgi:hypothetical protein